MGLEADDFPDTLRALAEVLGGAASLPEDVASAGAAPAISDEQWRSPCHAFCTPCWSTKEGRLERRVDTPIGASGTWAGPLPHAVVERGGLETRSDLRTSEGITSGGLAAVAEGTLRSRH